MSTVAGARWRNAPSLPRYLAALGRGERPARELEPLDAGTQARERVLLGLRLDEPLATAGLDAAIDRDALTRLERLGPRRVSGAGDARADARAAASSAAASPPSCSPTAKIPCKWTS